MTSASLAWQWGQRGSGRGVSRGGGRRVLLPLQASQHPERVRVDGAGAHTAPSWIPHLPIDGDMRRFRFQPALDAGEQVLRAHAEPALSMQHGDITIRRAEPLDSFLPGSVSRPAVDARAQSASPVDVAGALLHLHLAEAEPQDYPPAADA